MSEDRYVELVDLEDFELLESLVDVPLAEASEIRELRSLLAGGPGRPGHLTVSAWIFDPAFTLVLLVMHRALGWSNPGGHVKPGEAPIVAAVREVAEESGLRLDPFSPNPVSVHWREVASGPYPIEHYHWNLGFSFVADPRIPLRPEPDQAARWWPVEALPFPRVDDLDSGVNFFVREARGHV